MKFKRRVTLEQGLRYIDIAPLIDIVFQLLIFFMLTSSFIMQPGIRVNLPKASTSDIVDEENLIIIISREGVVYLQDTVVTTKELEDFLRKKRPLRQQLLIKADRGTALGRVVEVWDLCRSLGIERVNIATDPE